MDKSFKIALVGRPNVGKSALFNRIIKRRSAIVEDIEGITRDRLYAKAELFGKEFEVIDTGGLEQDKTTPFYDEVRAQTLLAIEEADSIVLVVDSKVGVTTLDEEVAKLLHRTKKPVCVAVNKVDNFHGYVEYPYYSLGIEKVVPVSALQGNQVVELLEAALVTYDPKIHTMETDPAIRVAIIGRPNVGKSTLLNEILGDNRVAVSKKAGTTRDSIDARITVDDKPYVFIDTAGIRKKKSESEVVEKFAFMRTQKAIERADVCVLLFDATEGLTAEEKKILRTVELLGKSCLLLANKWDLMKNTRMEHCSLSLRTDCSFSQNLPLVFISAKTGRNLDKVFSEIQKIYDAQTREISTPELNKFMEKTLQMVHPPMIKGKRLRIYYLTQINKAPLVFKLFINKKELMTLSYKRYILNQFREHFAIKGCPVILRLQGKAKRESALT
ncbi:MAG: GTPase Der [Chlamydiia bacterium]|nr:GTPase Der [Chlamydiia bacterium]